MGLSYYVNLPVFQVSLKRARSLRVGLKFRFHMRLGRCHSIPSYRRHDLFLNPKRFAHRF